jgi:hypothetical protein
MTPSYRATPKRGAPERHLSFAACDEAQLADYHLPGVLLQAYVSLGSQTLSIADMRSGSLLTYHVERLAELGFWIQWLGKGRRYANAKLDTTSGPCRWPKS